MEILIQHISTFTTIYCTDIISTENRLLDNSIIALLSFIIIQTIKYVITNWRQIYNYIIFHLYGMKNHPLEIWRAPYFYTTECSSEKFNKEYIKIGMFIYTYDITELIDITEYGILFDPLILKSKISYLCDETYTRMNPKGLYLGCNKVLNKEEEGLYVIGIDSHGNFIYYSTSGHIFYKNKSSFDSSIDLYLKEYLRNEAINLLDKNKQIDKGGIYVLKDIPNKEKSLIKIGEISKNKSFNNLFYTQKDELIHLLDKFKSKKMYPPHVSMDNKLGILLYGPPGTGKTGTITAIANYLERGLTIINFTDITTIEDFEIIFNSKNYKNTIFVFDEFDCILDVLGGKTNETSNSDNKNDWGTMLLAAEGEERKQILEMVRSGKKLQKQTLNIAYLLQKLDGLESAEDRIIVATTNNPDKINQALLRPGRFDIKLCLGNCTKDMYYKILQNFYKNEKDVYKRVLKANIQEFKYSPLEIMNMSMQHDTLQSLLQCL